MKILHLILKKKYFESILSGAKTEEYREVKPYWEKRLCKKYDIIRFQNGYSKNAPFFYIKLLGIQIKERYFEITKKQIKVFALKLGEIIDDEFPKK